MKINIDETSVEEQGFKRGVQKSSEEITRYAKRVQKIQERADIEDDTRVNEYFVRILKRVVQVMKLRGDLVNEKTRDRLLMDLRSHEEENQSLSD